MSSNCQGAGPAQQAVARPGTATAAALRSIDSVPTAMVDVSASTGRPIAGPLTAWTTGDGADTVEHVAGTTTGGALLVFYRSRHSQGWRVVDASVEAGRTLAGLEDLTSWVTKDGEFTVEHVAGRGANNAMLVFYWSRRHGRWRVVDATAESGRRVAGGLTSWVTRSGPYTVEHVAGVASDGHLTVFWWSPAAGRWKAVDATRIARGPNASGTARALPPATGQSGPEMVVSRSAGGGLLLSWWGSALDWQVTDLAATTGSTVVGNPVTWTVPQDAPERIAVRAANGHLLVFASDAQDAQRAAGAADHPMGPAQAQQAATEPSRRRGRRARRDEQRARLLLGEQRRPLHHRERRRAGVVRQQPPAS